MHSCSFGIACLLSRIESRAQVLFYGWLIVSSLFFPFSALNTALWWARENSGGYAAATFAKLRAIAKGEIRPDEEASFGNGSVMRIAPIGFAYRNSPKLREIVGEALRWSHTHPEAIDASTIMCVLVAKLLTASKPLKTESLLQELIERCETDELRKRLVAVQARLRLELPIEPLFDEGEKAFLQSICTPEKWFQIRAIDALTYVIFVFFRHGENRPAQCLVRMIALGGDCDTTASMIGSLLGAFHGTSWLREDWLRPLRKVDLVRKLACRLSLLDCVELVPADVAELKEKLKTVQIPNRHE